jgi:hypothetical protein
MFVMYDSVDLSQVPHNPHAVAVYRNGRYANEREARARFPHAHILTIDVTGSIIADCLDIERYDATPQQAPGWINKCHRAGIWRPCLYASENVWKTTLWQLLQDAQIPHTHYRAWVAKYDGLSQVPNGFDAKQFTDRALGRNLDESVCSDGFFPTQASKPPVHHWDNASISFNPHTGQWKIHGTPAS